MNNNYFRITGYCKEKDFCFIVDSYGYFEKLWQLSSAFVIKGIEVVSVSSSEKFLDGNISREQVNVNHVFVRAECKGKPQQETITIDGITYKALRVGNKIYVPDKMQTI